MTFPKKYVLKEFHFSLMEFAFLELNVEFNFFELVQNKSNMLFMFLHVLGKHEDAIHVTCDKIIQVFMKNIVHQMLKDGRGIRKTKRHHHIFKMTIIGSKKIFHSSSSRIHTRLYISHRLILVKTLTLLN